MFVPKLKVQAKTHMLIKLVIKGSLNCDDLCMFLEAMQNENYTQVETRLQLYLLD